MSRPVAVLRPQPGNEATAARVEAIGLTALRLPLFEARPLAWSAPDPAAFDALLLTSATTPRVAGPELARFAALPAHAVGAATAEAARLAGLNVVTTGSGDAGELIAAAEEAGARRALFLSGRDHVLQLGGIVTAIVPVYAMDPLPIDPAGLPGCVALVHSARAGQCLAALVGDPSDRATIAIAAISPAAAEAAGSGWRTVAAADRPNDDALLALARVLAD